MSQGEKEFFGLKESSFILNNASFSWGLKGLDVIWLHIVTKYMDIIQLLIIILLIIIFILLFNSRSETKHWYAPKKAWRHRNTPCTPTPYNLIYFLFTGFTKYKHL